MLRSKKVEYRADSFLSYPTLPEVPKPHRTLQGTYMERTWNEKMTQPTGICGCNLTRAGKWFRAVLWGVHKPDICRASWHNRAEEQANEMPVVQRRSRSLCGTKMMVRARI
jgi:hypothetical protein